MKNKILHGDCLELMKDIPDGSIDMILADLPYGTTACKWDTIIPFVPLWEAYERVIKPNGAIVLTASQPFTSALVMSNPNIFKCEWIWEKNRGSNFATVKYQPMKEHESILIFSKGKSNYYPIKEDRQGQGKDRVKYKFQEERKNVSENYGIKVKHKEFLTEKRVPRSIQKFNTETGLHPTQKPVPLFQYLIKTYTNEGETVLDNTAGSGTTAIACLEENRNFIVMEKELEYYEIIKKRVANFKKVYEQKTLFETVI
jgi:site-specific DNA-methyltransferase (adenine-specific)